MIVSRADIPTDRIMNYPGAFLKVPIDRYLEELNIEPLPSQIALINGINNPKYRFGCAALSRRQGKTFIANVVGQVVALFPGSHVLIMAPNYNLSSISFDLQRSLIKRFELEVSKDNAKDRVIELSNGSTIRIGSVSQVDSCVGRSYDLIIFDESALTTEGKDAFNVSLRPTLDKPNSKAIFISTPRGKNNWFSEFFDRGFSPEFPQWFSIKATWRDNPRSTEEDIEEAKRTMSAAQFAQEFEADFSIYEGKIWNLRPEHIRDLSELDFSKCDKIAGLDLGFKDHTAFVVGAFSWEDETFYILDEYFEAEKTTEGHAAEISKLMNKWNIDYIYIDSANQQQRYDFAQLYDIPTTNAKKSLLDGIGYVASLVDTGRVIVDSSCKEVQYSFDQYRWNANESLLKEKPIHDRSSHMADAIRYMLYSYKLTSGGF